MEKPTQYLLVGYPYSGKSTLSRELTQQLGFAHINIDQIKWDKGYTDVGDDDVPEEAWGEIFKEADRLIIEHLQEGRNIANEYAWITREWRDRARNIAKKSGFPTKLIYIKLPEDTIRERWRANQQTKERFHWPKEEFERIFSEFEEPTEDEDILIYDQSIPVDQWIKENLDTTR